MSKEDDNRTFRNILDFSKGDSTTFQVADRGQKLKTKAANQGTKTLDICHFFKRLNRLVHDLI